MYPQFYIHFLILKDEKFRNDVNGKNSVYLIDEEITEILVRHKYNVEQALVWSMKSNPEFQYYVKRKTQCLFLNNSIRFSK